MGRKNEDWEEDEDPGRHFFQKVPPRTPPQKLLLFGPLKVVPLMRHRGGRCEVSLVSILSLAYWVGGLRKGRSGNGRCCQMVAGLAPLSVIPVQTGIHDIGQ